jgi:hypothetical protein
VAVVEEREEDPARMSAEACRKELAAEEDPNMLRALVAVRRMLHEMQAGGVTGKLEGHVHEGRLRGWHYPKAIKL